jgi:hypothetical protein
LQAQEKIINKNKKQGNSNIGKHIDGIKPMSGARKRTKT